MTALVTNTSVATNSRACSMRSNTALTRVLAYIPTGLYAVTNFSFEFFYICVSQDLSQNSWPFKSIKNGAMYAKALSHTQGCI